MTTRRDWAVAALLIVFVTGWLGFEITRGIFTSSDELFTAERTREMLLLDRDQVHLNFRPSYSKPPLQYWLTSLTLALARHTGWKQEPAVRVWPLIFGILTAAALVWLAYLANERRKGPLALPALAILVSCPLFTTEISRALLDSGLVFLTTLGLVFAQLARKEPRWWDRGRSRLRARNIAKGPAHFSYLADYRNCAVVFGGGADASADLVAAG